MRNRLLNTFLSILAGQGAGILANIILVPLFLSRWTAGQYGEWLVIGSTVAYLTTLDMGLQMYAVNRLTQAHAKHDVLEYRSVQHSALALYCGTAITASTVLLLAANLVPIKPLLGVVEISVGQARWTTILLGMQIIWGIPVGFIIAFSRTIGSQAVTQWLYNAQQLAARVLIGIGLLLHASPAQLAGLQLVPIAVSGLGTLIYVRRARPELAFGFSEARRDVVRTMVRPSSWFAATMAAGALRSQGTILTIAHTLGPAQVALYSTMRTVANTAQQAVNIFATASWTELTLMHAKQDERFPGAMRMLVAVIVGGTLIAATTLWFDAAPLLAFWTRHALVLDLPTFRSILLQVGLGSFWLATSMVPATTNQHRVLAIAYLGGSAAGLVFGMIGARIWGLAALPLGMIVGDAVFAYHLVPKEACRIAGIGYARFATRGWFCMAASLAIGWLAAWVGSALPVHWFWRLASSGVLCAVTTTSLVYLLILEPSDRARILARTTSQTPAT